jgi:hypothetical protein
VSPEEKAELEKKKIHYDAMIKAIDERITGHVESGTARYILEMDNARREVERIRLPDLLKLRDYYKEQLEEISGALGDDDDNGNVQVYRYVFKD